MKNKGRRHKAAYNEEMSGVLNCKGCLRHITRSIEKMGKNPFYKAGVSKKYVKQKWSKRVRGYFKSRAAIHWEINFAAMIIYVRVKYLIGNGFTTFQRIRLDAKNIIEWWHS